VPDHPGRRHRLQRHHGREWGSDVDDDDLYPDHGYRGRCDDRDDDWDDDHGYDDHRMRCRDVYAPHGGVWGVLVCGHDDGRAQLREVRARLLVGRLLGRGVSGVAGIW
jgi:hypothetical protein